MKLIRKAKMGIEIPEAKSDNTRVARIIIPEINKPKLKFTPKGLLALFTSDNRTPQQKETDYRVGNYLSEQNEIKQNTAKGLAALGTFVSPSTYIGPGIRMALDTNYRNNGQPYWLRVTLGEGAGSILGNLVTDVAAFGLPGLIRKGVSSVSKNMRPLKEFQTILDSRNTNGINTTSFNPPLLESPDFSKLPKKPEALDVNVMAPEVKDYFVKGKPYRESFHSDKDHATVIGEYQNPGALIYYDNIVKPLLKDHQDLLVKPIKILKFDTQPRWAGIHRSSTLENFVGLNIPEAKRVYIHEAVGHGSLQYVNPEDYKFLFFDRENNPFEYTTHFPLELDLKVKYNAIIPWDELRSTFEEARSELYEIACLKFGKILNLEEFNNYLDTLSDLDIFKSMYVNSKNHLRNGYAGRMAMPFKEINDIFLERTAPPKSLVSKYRTLYKTLPVVGFPIIGGTYLKLNNETNKKGKMGN